MSNLKKLSTLFMAVLFTFAFAQDVTLTFGDVDLDGGTMEIYMVNTVPVAGFQLMMDNVDLLGAGGGSAAAAGFITNTNASGLVLGFSLSGATIPVGEGVLTVLTVGGLLNPDGQACIASATLSDSNGGPLTAEYSDCWPFMEPQLEAPTNLMAVGGDGEIMLSWDHEASRDVVDLSISNYDAEAGQLAIYMANTELVGGFQFELDASFPDFLVTSVSGGTAAAAGFIMNSNAGGLVLGFSLSGATIPVGEGVLCYVGVSFTGEDGNFSIATATMSDAGGGPLSTTIGGPYYIGEIPEVITYNVYRDGGLFMEGLDMMSYTDMGLGYSETHCYTVTAFDGENESAHSNEACATTNPSPEDLYAPFGLTAEGGINYVDLAWIDGAPVEAQWISYDNGVNNDGIGVDGAADFDVAIRFDTSQIAPFAGGQLTEVRFFPREELCEYAVRVWIGGSAFNAGTMVLDQAVTNPVIGDWNNVVLDVPVDIEPGMELWFGYRANTQAGFPAGCDAGPATPGYSDLILFGGAWVSMAQAYSLNYNWNIQGYVSNGG
nr:hypothetical protein [FCB group bacterium]